MREIRTSGLMSGDGKRGIATAPVLDSTIHRRSMVNCKFAWFAIALRVAERDRRKFGGFRRQSPLAVAYRWLGRISVRSQNQAYHCRRRSELGGGDWPLAATSACAAICSSAD